MLFILLGSINDFDRSYIIYGDGVSIEPTTDVETERRIRLGRDQAILV